MRVEARLDVFIHSVANAEQTPVGETHKSGMSDHNFQGAT